MNNQAKTPIPDEIWSILRETAQQQKEADKKLQILREETEKQRKETEKQRKRG